MNKSDKLKDILKDAPQNIKQSKVMTKMPSCMDKQYIVSLAPKSPNWPEVYFQHG